MSFFLLKSILASIFLLSAIGAAASMLTMMGKAEKKISPKTLVKIHKICGRVFLILLLPLLFLGMRYWTRIGDQASLRAVFHAVLASGFIIIVLLKVAIVKFYKQFLRFAPVLGMLVFSFAFVVFSISAGYYSARALNADLAPSAEVDAVEFEIVESPENGAAFFKANCLSCHHADKEDKKLGPGLKDLLKKEKLPHSGRPATVENVRQQLIRPVLTMPSFARLTDQEMADLIAYLKIL
jgi:cytochrome c553